MDCDLEFERGVDKGPQKRGTSKYISRLLPFRKCSPSVRTSHGTPNRRQQLLHSSIFLKSSCPFCDDDDASSAGVNAVVVGGRLMGVFFEPIPALGFEAAVLGTKTFGAPFVGFPAPPGFFLIASS